jgi:hypothetical protein
MNEGEQRPQPSQPEQTQPLQGRTEGRQSLQGPTTVEDSEQPQSTPDHSITPQKQPTLPQKSILSHAIEQTRSLYEQCKWDFLPLTNPGKFSPDVPILEEQLKPVEKDQSIANPPSPLFSETQNRAILSAEDIGNQSKDLNQQREEAAMPQVYTPVWDIPGRQPEKVTFPEWEVEEIKESIRNLQEQKTQHQRITEFERLAPEDRDKLHQYDQEFIEPISKGLSKRPARIEKAARLLYRITEGDLSGRKINYSRLADDAMDTISPPFNPDWRSVIPEQYYDQLFEAVDDLHDTLCRTREDVERRDPRSTELVGVSNAICCAHDVLSVFKEAGVPPPNVYRRTLRRLEKRRAFLDPNYTQGRHP